MTATPAQTSCASCGRQLCDCPDAAWCAPAFAPYPGFDPMDGEDPRVELSRGNPCAPGLASRRHGPALGIGADSFSHDRRYGR